MLSIFSFLFRIYVFGYNFFLFLPFYTHSLHLYLSVSFIIPSPFSFGPDSSQCIAEHSFPRKTNESKGSKLAVGVNELLGVSVQTKKMKS